ncbi:MAG: DinB family protein [Bacteroidetes bacterium]|nr:DinB family protein [Bacteroidota bacterium]
MNSKVQLLKWMLEDVRAETLKGIEGLNKEQFFKAPLEGEFPIGAFLMHFGEVDTFWYSQLTGEQMPDELRKRVYENCWFDCPAEEFNPPKEAPEVNEYLDAISETRKILFEYMDKMNDKDLDIFVRLKKNGEPMTKKWIIYHLIEHEAHHRGQMFMLIRKGKLRE